MRGLWGTLLSAALLAGCGSSPIDKKPPTDCGSLRPVERRVSVLVAEGDYALSCDSARAVASEYLSRFSVAPTAEGHTAKVTEGGLKFECYIARETDASDFYYVCTYLEGLDDPEPSDARYVIVSGGTRFVPG